MTTKRKAAKVKGRLVLNANHRTYWYEIYVGTGRDIVTVESVLPGFWESKRSARTAARRWAKKLNIELIEEPSCPT